ncbi:bromodomain-containing protein 8-like isoform X2 [Antennarius striatus]|uniref:bromodomain-containing protein 8-like isoform X2 n=1 Tax=Antennarius striatus TaxID=241820 RepID=UPI0035B1C491
MANGIGKHKLLVIGPTEPWSVREKLCLATSVMKSGDQNWVSVSRAIKPFAESGRPPDWFSQKHCASKYSELLETTETPKRKRGEKGDGTETIEDLIVRRLTADRIEELNKLIKETKEKHRKLKREAELIQAGHLDSKLEKLWEETLQRKKLEEEEAQLKRKNTDAAYQARQVAKNASKQMSGITIRSPSDCSLSQEFRPGEPLECLTLDLASAKNHSRSVVRLMTISAPLDPGKDNLNHSSLFDDHTQKTRLVQKATPSPSPLLSELLKKGNILATNFKLLGEGELSAVNATGGQDVQLSPPGQLLSQAAGAPMLSRLLEPGPTQIPPPLDLVVCADSPSMAPLSAATPVSVDSAASVHTEVQIDVSAEDKVSELSEEDGSVTYMGDELDLKTVGDIIAIIEDKADETVEALDAAAVEAALLLCEENGHAFSSACGPFQPHESYPSVPTGVAQSLPTPSLHSSLGEKTETSEVQGRTLASLSSLCNSRENCLAAFSTGPRNLTPTSSSSCDLKSLRHCHTGTPPQPEAKRLDTRGMVHQTYVTIQRESKKWERQRSEEPHGDSVLEVNTLTGRQSKAVDGTSVGRGKTPSGIKVHSEVNGLEECGEEEGDTMERFSSEPDGEDRFSPQAASISLQLHTNADSIPSSPASSQFSMCSEDLEALQAHKIWKKAIMLVWRAAANHRYANVFLQPVTEEIAPGYHSIVHRPMDLATIKKNIETGLIRTTAEFQREIMLMFQNAVMYNSLDHDVYHMAVEMQRDVLEQIQQFLATQLIMETSESGITAKSLRGRENTRKQDSTDKDGGTRGRRCAIEADLKMKK